MSWLLVLNDVVWAVAAVSYMLVDEPMAWMQVVMAVTTTVYAGDLVMKFKAFGWKLKPFMKKHWLDVLFLVPFVKMFRAIRFVRAGHLLMKSLIVLDTLNDLSEMAFRCVGFVKKSKFRRLRISKTCYNLNCQADKKEPKNEQQSGYVQHQQQQSLR